MYLVCVCAHECLIHFSLNHIHMSKGSYEFVRYHNSTSLIKFLGSLHHDAWKKNWHFYELCNQKRLPDAQVRLGYTQVYSK